MTFLYKYVIVYSINTWDENKWKWKDEERVFASESNRNNIINMQFKIYVWLGVDVVQQPNKFRSANPLLQSKVNVFADYAKQEHLQSADALRRRSQINDKSIWTTYVYRRKCTKDVYVWASHLTLPWKFKI